MILENKIQLGEEVMVSDPCYSVGTWCQIKLDNVLPGSYTCSFTTEDGGTRVGRIRVVHESVSGNDVDDSLRLLQEGTVGVDSGMAGIYDMSYYKDHHKKTEDDLDEEWYEDVYHKTFRKIPNPSYKPINEREWVADEYNEFEESIKELFLHYPVEDVYYAIRREIVIITPNNDFTREITSRLTFLKESVGAAGLSVNTDPNALQKDAEAITEKFIRTYLRKTNQMEEIWVDLKEIDGSLASDMDGKCLVSSAGYGDGTYDCYVAENDDGKIIAIEVVFIGDEVEDEDE